MSENKKRIYTKVKEIEPEIMRMREEGKTRSEIAEILGLPSYLTVKRLISRINRKHKNLVAMPLKKRGRPRKSPITSQKALEIEFKRLQMENELLRSFLLEAGRWEKKSNIE